MNSKVTKIDVNSGKYSSPVSLAIVYDVKKAREDRDASLFMDQLELENNSRYYNNKGLAESMTMATSFQGQQATLKYYSDQIKRTEKLYTMIQALKEKMEAQKIMKKELLKTITKT